MYSYKQASMHVIIEHLHENSSMCFKNIHPHDFHEMIRFNMILLAGGDPRISVKVRSSA